MKYRLAVFDMDGTILDTIGDLHAATNHALRSYNLPERSLDEVRSFVGNGLHKLVERAVPAGSSDETIDRVHGELIDYYGKHTVELTKPYDGIPEVIDRLRAAGVKTAVVSNKVDPAVTDLVHTFFEGLFDFSMGEQKGFAIKPNPDMVDEILRRSGFDRSEAVYIGDSEVDLQTAVNSKMDCIAVSWGFRGRKILEELKAETIVDSPSEIFDIIIN